MSNLPPDATFIDHLHAMKRKDSGVSMALAERLTQNPTILKMVVWKIKTIFLMESFHILLPPLELVWTLTLTPSIKNSVRLKPLQNKKGQNNLGYQTKKQSFYKEKRLLFGQVPQIFWPFLFCSGFSTKVERPSDHFYSSQIQHFLICQ